MTSSSNGTGPRRQALGRGLGALIPAGAKTEEREFFHCPIHRIRATADQPRQMIDGDALDELTRSIEADGLLQPLVVRQDGADYRIIAGERRWRAAQRAGLDSVPVVIKDVDADSAYELALVENIQRRDLNPLEEAEAYRRIMELRGYSQAELANRLGKSRPAVANTLRLLGLHDDVRFQLSSGTITEGAARALLALPTDEHQVELADAITSEGLSVRQVESVVRRVKGGQQLEEALTAELRPAEIASTESVTPPARSHQARSVRREPSPATPEQRDLAERLQRLLGTRVAVHDKGGRGSIEIFWNDYDALDDILARLGE